MENVKAYYTQKDAFKALKNIWQSDLFKKQMENPQSKLYKFIKEVSRFPFIQIDYSDRKYERPHHYAWMNILPTRSYPNPYIHDLYVFHELWHKLTMKYFSRQLGDFNFFQFMKKMRENEIEASNMSEVVIYYWIPGLREKTFEHEIWADRFLNEKQSLLQNLEVPEILKGLSNQELYDHRYGFFLKALEDQRKRIVYANIDSLVDQIERQIKAYDKNNNEFMLIWQKNAEKIEMEISKFYEICDNPVFGKELERKKMATNHLLDFLYKNMKNTTYPFPDEAKAFAKIFYGFKASHNFETLDVA